MRGSDHYWGDWCGYDGIAKAYYYIPINFQQAYDRGSRFTWLKACDGLSKTRFFHNAYADAKKIKGFGVGAYLWQYKGELADAKKQADFWYSEIAQYNCAASVDFEAWQNNIPEAKDLWASGYRMRENGFTQKLIIYTNWAYWLEHGNSDPAWKTVFDGIWLADPDDVTPTPPPYATADKGRKAPRPFDDYLFHQFSWSGDPALYGVNNGKLAIDEDRWNGSEDGLQAFFNNGEIIPPIEPPPGETMIVKALVDKVNIRKDHSTASEDVGDFLKGQTAEVLEVWESGSVNGIDYEQWARTASGWIAAWYRTQGKLCDLIGEIVTPPAGLPTINIRLEAEGYPPFEGVWKPS
jgi:hypothetical protein